METLPSLNPTSWLQFSPLSLCKRVCGLSYSPSLFMRWALTPCEASRFTEALQTPENTVGGPQNSLGF